MSTTTKDDLMSSLMGGGGGDQDLFGEIPDVATTTTPTHDPPPPVVPVPPPPPPGASIPPAPETAKTASSFLSASGLLGNPAAGKSSMNGGGGGGGLFDEIDEEEEKKNKEEEERLAEQQRAEEEARRRQKEEEQRRLEEQRKQQQFQQQQQQQQLQDQMQSIHLGPAPSAYPPNGMQQNMQQPQQQLSGNNSMMQNSQMTGGASYMHQPQQQQQQPSQMMQSSYMQQQQQPSQMQNSYMQQQQPSMQTSQQIPPQQPMIHSQPPAQGSYVNQAPVATPQQQQQASMMQQQQQPNGGFYRNPPMQQQSPSNGSRFYSSPVRGSVTAGMHGPGGTGGAALPSASMMLHQHEPPPQYTKVTVTEPLLLGSPTVFGIGQPPHWSYHVSTQLQNGTVWQVRRRFRHVVALEDRMREECPGAILPPRPDKHATRAIEEASAHQSAEFAVQRAAELQYYLNQMIQHPYASTSLVLRLFLSLQDDLGHAWPECSTNALTRLTNASVGAAVKVSEKTASIQNEAGEDNAELLALQNAESIRMGAVLQAVPKLEGAVTLLREQAELMLAVGMEFSRVAKEVSEAQPLDIASSGLLRAGRRSKRMVMELSAAMQSYSHHYKLCRYERMAFTDRRAAITRRHKERHRADQRASQLMMHQQQHRMQMANSAVMMDDMAMDAGQECEEIGMRLRSEVHRIAHTRRGEWSASVKIVASAMKEALTERVAIWEAVQENFLQSFPEYNNVPAATGGGPPQQVPQQQQHQMPHQQQQQRMPMQMPMPPPPSNM